MKILKKLLLLFLVFSLNLFGDVYYFSNGEKIVLTKISNTRVLAQDGTVYYETEFGHKVGVRDEILVECEDGVECKKLLLSYNVKKVSSLSKKLFIVKIFDNENIFEVSQKLYNDNKIKLAHPNFMRQKKRR